MASLINIDGFTIELASLVCPNCQQPFAASIAAVVPELTMDSPVETDLHRVLPDAMLRGALVVICPHCVYSSWSSAFEVSEIDPSGLTHAPEVENSKKFAHAVLSARKMAVHSVERAMFALNGYWCARESGTETERWLTLAAQELVTALSDDNWYGNRDRYHYLLGEIYRLLGDFKNAVGEYNRVEPVKAKLPRRLIEEQRQHAMSRSSAPVMLADGYKQVIFFLETWRRWSSEEDIMTVPVDLAG